MCYTKMDLIVELYSNSSGVTRSAVFNVAGGAVGHLATADLLDHIKGHVHARGHAGPTAPEDFGRADFKSAWA